MPLPCANPACRLHVVCKTVTGLCSLCEREWLRYRYPVGGFIPSNSLWVVGKTFLKAHNPTQSEMTEALKIMRGPRHRSGPWEQRPPYRLSPLLYGRWNVRLPHVLVGRRREPSMRGLSMALAHYHLAKSILGTTSRYPLYLAGCTWMSRSGLSAPKGAEVLKGDAKHTGYRLHLTDYTSVGRTVLKAGETLGLQKYDREVTDRITSIYLELLHEGTCRGPVVVPRGSRPTFALGDNPFDHLLPANHHVPRQYHNKIRRASGAISREWPEGMDLSWEDVEAQRQAIREAERRRHQANRTTYTDTTPDTSWLFEGT